MREFRFSGVSVAGEAIRGNVYAPTRRAASKRIGVLSDKHEFDPDQLEERFVFKYKIRHPSGQIVKGQQKAFTHEEVTLALERLGLEVVSVRKKAVRFQR